MRTPPTPASPHSRDGEEEDRFGVTRRRGRHTACRPGSRRSAHKERAIRAATETILFVAAARVRRRGGWLRARIARAGCRARIRSFVTRDGENIVMARSLCALRQPPRRRTHETARKRIASASRVAGGATRRAGRAVGAARIKSEPLRYFPRLELRTF